LRIEPRLADHQVLLELLHFPLELSIKHWRRAAGSV
jgi:hypothetical protein